MVPQPQQAELTALTRHYADLRLAKLISPLRPGLIESPDTGDFVYLIMPIRLNV